MLPVNFVISVFVRTLVIMYKWLDQYLIIHVANFVKSFEFAIVIVAAVTFLLISLFFTIRFLKRLPKSYTIEIDDIFGKKTIVEDLKVVFRTYDVAQSYASYYSEIYKNQYKFRVVGLKE
jgi:hypothetical protein